METPDTESEPFVVVTDTTKMKWTVKELRELLKEEIRTLLENGATIATEEELSRSTPTDRKVRMTNTPDIEIEDVLDMLNSCVIMERDVDLQYAILDYKKAEQIIYHLISSRDTYWKERVRKGVEGKGIICGFAGIGKSTLAKNMAGVVDLESTPFEKDWKRYVKVAKHMRDNGYTVLLSCHKELREELHTQGIPYRIALPNSTARQEYLERYKQRGNDEVFIKLMDENWEKFRERLPWESEYILVRSNLQETLSPPSSHGTKRNY